jgi:hypothetical protein
MVRKRTADKRAHDSSDTIRRSSKPEQLRTRFRRRDQPNDCKHADDDTGRTHTRDRTADDQRNGVLGYRADEASKLKDEYPDEVPQLQGEVLVQLSPS